MLAELTSAQARAVHHPAARLQIMACAGSGKTEVLARRAVRLLLEGTEPAALVAFTFTEKAAAELKARIELRAAEADERFRALPPVGRGMFIGTTHGWALQTLRELGGRYETMDALTPEQEWVLLHRTARRLGVVDLFAELEEKARDKVAAAPAIDVFLRSAEVVHDARIDRGALRERAKAFAEALERYEWLLERMRLLPFRLMIAAAIRELEPGGRLRQRLEGRLAHVLVDEFQDLNPAQDRVLGLLAELGAAITVVGDDDQAIYQWRGGDVSLFVSFAQRYQGSERSDLAENRRCRPEIVRFACQLVSRLPERLDKVLESARQPAASGAVEAFCAQTPEEEARAIAKRIEALIEQKHAPGDIAVLYRSVRTSALPLVEELRKRRIPMAVVGKTSLLARPEMALIARIFVWWAGGTWYPNPQFEPEVITKESLQATIGEVTGLAATPASERLRRLEALGARVLAEGATDSVALLDEMLALLGLPGSDDEAQQREISLGQMSELLAEFDNAARRAAPRELYQGLSGAKVDEAQEDGVMAAGLPESPATVLGASRGQIYLMRLRAFLEHFAGRAAEETPEAAAGVVDAVRIMTVHQAKGLEFPIVFVPCLVEGRFPSRRMGQPQLWHVPAAFFDRARYEGREEDEARLLYVALTRAKELLVVSWFRKHAARKARPSRFLERHLKAALKDAMQAGTVQPATSVAVRGDDLLDLDFSRLTTYMECGYRYWLRHICGFKPQLAPELGFGRLLHHLVAELARKARAGQSVTQADVASLLNDSFYLPFAGSIPAERLRESALRRVGRYLQDFGHKLPRTLRPEAPFEVPLAHARLRGRIDLLLRAAGGAPNQVELIDFKTSENRPPSNFHKNQLQLYAAAAAQLGLEPVRLAIHDLDAETGQRIEVPHDATERDAFRGRLEQWVDGIQGGRFAPVEDPAVCRKCDFNPFCRHSCA
jgi:DNA helicase-2/ATP-dependent DNA helicase PcrA